MLMPPKSAAAAWPPWEGKMDTQHKKPAPNRNRDAEKTSFTPRERRIHDRRKKSDMGYMYISTVGWIDRRETGRRSRDIFLF
jgi:hypothetical protein